MSRRHGRPATLLPSIGWLRRYQRGWLRGDAVAGLTIAVVLIPQGMAYAVLAGMPAITGLYASIVALVVYGLTATSSHVSPGPAALVSLMVASALAPLAAEGTAEYVALAGLLALMVGVLQVAMGLLRLGQLVNFLSHPVIVGFTAAAGLVIGASQLPDLFGIDVEPRTPFLELTWTLLRRLGETDPWTAGLGIASVTAMLLGRRLAPRVPTPLCVMAAATAATWLLGLDARGVDVLGQVPSGLPRPTVPPLTLALASELLTAAVTIAVVGYAMHISIAKAVAVRSRNRIDADQELVASGVMNGAAGFFSGFPVSGSFTRSAVNYEAGATTQLAGVIAAIGLALTTQFLTPLFSYLPQTVLAGIVVAAVLGLVDVRESVRILRMSRDDGLALLAALGGTLLLGLEPGIALGVAVAAGLSLLRSMRPRMVEVGQVVGEPVFRDITRFDTWTDARVAILRVEAGLTYLNAEPVMTWVSALVAERDQLQAVVLDASAVARLDASGAHVLQMLHDELGRAGVELHFATLRGPVRDALDRAGLWEKMAAGRSHPRIADALEAVGVRPPQSPGG